MLFTNIDYCMYIYLFIQLFIRIIYVTIDSYFLIIVFGMETVVFKAKTS